MMGHLPYAGTRDGGVTLTVKAAPKGPELLRVDWTRQQALDAAATILTAAGITEAEFRRGRLRVWE